MSSSHESPSLKFHRLLQDLPVDLSSFVLISKTDPNSLVIFSHHVPSTAQQILVVLLNEPDNRISNRATKLQALEVLLNIANSSRTNRIKLRLTLQENDKWFTDDVYSDPRFAGELLPERDPMLIKLAKVMFSKCWRTDANLLKQLIADKDLSLEDCKMKIIAEYAVVCFQSLIRSHQARTILRSSLKNQADEREEEIRNWSILILQKVARGYIARKTVLRSMRIRKSLSKEVLRVTERYLTKGDLWGFLKEINDELGRLNGVIVQNQQREDDWAQNFVQKVILKRQEQFDESWDKFPKALAALSGKTNSVASLIDHDSSSSKVGVEENTKHQKHIGSSKGSLHQTKKGEITVREVASAVRHNDLFNASTTGSSIPGPLMRKAISNSVNAAVTDQLNKLVNDEFRSRKLVKDFRDVYAPPLSNAKPSVSLSPINKSSASTRKRPDKKKHRVGIDGKPIVNVGKISASHSDWMGHSIQKEVLKDGHGEAIADHPTALGPGESLILDIPNGLNDTIERLMYAAAIRCYVPDFFRGVVPPPTNDDLNAEVEDGLDDETYAARAKLRRQQTQANPNDDPSYAYKMYLLMPLGLAKMRYEQQCRKWSQGAINKLRVKGLKYLSDVFPLSKFVMCMKSVDTPRPLMNQCIDIFLELKNIGKQTLHGDTDQKSISKLNRSIQKSSKADYLSKIDESRPTFDAESSELEAVSHSNAEDVFIDNRYLEGNSSREGNRFITSPDIERSELPGKVLLSMIEDQEKGTWCDLRAPIEDIFLHAAFLVVPFTKTVLDVPTDKTKPSRTKMIESNMGNFAFKKYTEQLMQMSTAEEKREAAKERFRACFILTTPFTLFLKSKQVFIVEDLLKVNLTDLEMPKALEVQLEVLLVVVVSKCVGGKIIPVPRDHLSTAEEMFTVPMFYDPKFQRSPFDPYGRPPRLQPKGKQKMIQHKLKAEEKIRAQKLKAHLNLDKVSTTHSIQEDLDIPVDIWNAFNSEGSVPDVSTTRDVESLITGESNKSTLDNKWSFRDVISDIESVYSDELSMSNTNSQQLLQSNASHYGGSLMQSEGGVNDKRPGRIAYHETKSSDKLTRSIDETVFKHTYTCTYPHCHQSFARLYTFKIHLKSHEVFGQYHEFKRKPQLYLDKDKAELADVKRDAFQRRITLPPVIERQLTALKEKS